jgi:hypothetical protein
MVDAIRTSVPPDHEYRRSGTDFPLPARTGGLAIFTQPKAGKGGVQALSDNLSATQLTC